MRKFHLLFFMVIGLLATASCSDSAGDLEKAIGEIAVKWELLTNFVDDKGSFNAAFIFENNSKMNLGDKGWGLYFNMSPRPLLIPVEQQLLSIEHINGDWYQIKPNPGFQLAPGESVQFPYSGTEGVIKETDAPMGMYFVFYGENGEDDQIVEVDNLKISPFTRVEQLLRGESDSEDPISPAKRYRENQDLFLVNESELLQIIPTPYNLVRIGGKFILDNQSKIYYPNALANEAKYLRDKLSEITGTTFSMLEGTGDGSGIQLSTGKFKVNGKDQEAYKLRVHNYGIGIVGTDAAGVFYGVQSLLALLGPEVYLNPQPNIELDQVEVEDVPRFAFRSLHMDVSRNFQDKTTIKKTLDLMSHYKINHFLFYTTEDEGWRLEIEGLPELTEVGAQREHTWGMAAPLVHPAYGSGPFAYGEGRHGSGYYTKADFIEILEYAKARHITIIPELNFPGHARAAIKSMEARYNRFMAEGKEEMATEYRLIDPGDESQYLSAQAFKDNVVNVAQESTYRFYEKVVDEIAKMFEEAGLTMKIIHAGGDEVAEGAWTASPMAKELMESLKVKNSASEKGLELPTPGGSGLKPISGFDPKNLQTHFFRELLLRLEKRGLEVHVWEEMALMKSPEGHYVPNPEFVGRNVVPYIWNNMFDYPDLGYQLANMGYEVVLCNVSNFYFDLAYDNDPSEPGLYWAGFVNTRNAWTFAPFDWFKTTYKTSMGEVIDQEVTFKDMVRIHPDARKNIKGLEAQLWSETIKGEKMLEYYMLPKLLGFSESAWAKERSWEIEPEIAVREKEISENWNIFANTIAQRELPKLGDWNGGYNYRLAPPGGIIENGQLYANVDMPGLLIRYTEDGREPDESSPIFRGPLQVNSPTLRLKSFDRSGRSSRSSTLKLE